LGKTSIVDGNFKSGVIQGKGLKAKASTRLGKYKVRQV